MMNFNLVGVGLMRYRGVVYKGKGIVEDRIRVRRIAFDISWVFYI